MSDETYDDTYDDVVDEVGAEGNRIEGDDVSGAVSGTRALAVTEYVTRNLADDPDAIEVDVEERGDEVALMVHANPSDMGRLIGKRGRVIQALRMLENKVDTMPRKKHGNIPL